MAFGEDRRDVHRLFLDLRLASAVKDEHPAQTGDVALFSHVCDLDAEIRATLVDVQGTGLENGLRAAVHSRVEIIESHEIAEEGVEITMQDKKLADRLDIGDTLLKGLVRSDQFGNGILPAGGQNGPQTSLSKRFDTSSLLCGQPGAIGRELVLNRKPLLLSEAAFPVQHQRPEPVHLSGPDRVDSLCQIKGTVGGDIGYRILGNLTDTVGQVFRGDLSDSLRSDIESCRIGIELSKLAAEKIVIDLSLQSFHAGKGGNSVITIREYAVSILPPRIKPGDIVRNGSIECIKLVLIHTGLAAAVFDPALSRHDVGNSLLQFLIVTGGSRDNHSVPVERPLGDKVQIGFRLGDADRSLVQAGSLKNLAGTGEQGPSLLIVLIEVVQSEGVSPCDKRVRILQHGSEPLGRGDDLPDVDLSIVVGIDEG